MALELATAQTLAALAVKVQREVGDTGADRFTLADDIYDAVNDQLIVMANQMQLQHAGEALVYTSLTYSGDDPVNLPSAIGPEAVYRVQDYTNEDAPIELPYVPPNVLEDYAVHERTGDLSVKRYTLLGPATGSDGTTYRIQLGPRPEGARTLRIHYATTPWIFDSATASDTHPLSPRWRELIWLGASRKLLRRDEEWTITQEQQYQELWAQFAMASNRARGPQRIPRKRRGVS